MSDNDDKFNFIVTSLWPGTNQLRTYTYFNETQYGSQRAADAFLEYVKGKSPDIDWQILKIDTRPLTGEHSIESVTKDVIARIESQNWTDTPLSDRELNLIEMTVMTLMRG